MKLRLLALWLGVLAILAGGIAPLAAQAPASAPRVVLPDNAVPRRYAIAVEPDAEALTFKGRVSVDFTVRRGTATLVLNAADLVIDAAELSGVKAQPTVATDAKRETVTFTFATPLAPGDYSLSLIYHGKIYQQASGLFALDYDTAEGKKRVLYTQFEATDARRFVPCWDEPAQKAVFELEVTVPSALMPISNMPIVSTQDAGSAKKRVRFAPSPKMSSYLLFFGLGDFERISKKVDGVDIGLIVKRGETAKGEFALETAARILPYYNEYFGVPYPLPKLDLIAGPGSSQFFSAMENWGAIFYFETALLTDPKLTTDSDKHRIYNVTAHEMAHQWFGNLVTMDWWDDLWLNEGFASWMATKATDHFHPEWKVWLRSIGDVHGAMQTDARQGTHPVITPIADPAEAAGAFDNITYTKGQAVIRMLEAYTGEEAFRNGVRRYMKSYAYGNTRTDDLWKEVDAVSPRKITDIAHDFTLQAGVPLVTVTASGEQVKLTGSRYAIDASGESGGAWRVPALVAPAGRSDPAAVQRAIVTAANPATISGASLGSVVNAGQTGYFRTLYEGPAFTAMRDNYGTYAPDDQYGIISDTALLGNAGRAPMGNFLSLATRVPLEADPVVWQALVDRLTSLDAIYAGLPGQEKFRAFAREILAPKFQQLGWERKVGESDNTAILRPAMIGALGTFADAAVLREARARFARLLKEPASLSGSIRRTVLDIVAYNADAATWEQLHGLARAAGSSMEKQEAYNYVAGARDVVLVRRALDLTLTDEVPVTLRPSLVSKVAGNHPELAFDFVAAHWDIFSKIIEPNVQPRYLPRILGNASDTAVLAKLEAFAAKNFPPNATQELRKVSAAVRYSANLRATRLPEVDKWLETRGAGTK